MIDQGICRPVTLTIPQNAIPQEMSQRPPIRVAHVMRSFSPLSESFIYDHVVEMQRQEVECHVLSINRENIEARPFPDVTVIEIPSRASPTRIFYKAVGYAARREKDAYLWPLYRASLRTALLRIAPNAIHAHFGPEGAIVAPVARQLGIPLLVTFYGYDASILPRSERWRRRYLKLFRTADRFIGVSRHVCERLIELGADPAKVELVHLGVHADTFCYSDPAERFDGKIVRCIHVGRLTPKKSPLHLVEAFALAAAAVQPEIDLKLTIIGDGELRDAVHARIAALGIESRVEMLGALPHEQIRTHLARAHIYTQHSLTAENGDQEGLPVSIIEASASGLPVVSTFHSGIPEAILDGETGFLVEEGDVPAMADRIATLCQCRDLWSRFGAAGRAHVQANLSLPKLVRHGKSIVESLVVPQQDQVSYLGRLHTSRH